MKFSSSTPEPGPRAGLTAAICLLALSGALTTPSAAAEDWQALWRQVLPDVEAPSDPIEAEEVFWTYYVERRSETTGCLGTVQLLYNGVMQRHDSGVEMSTDAMALVLELGKETTDRCMDLAAGGVHRDRLLHALGQAGRDKAVAMQQAVGRGEAVAYTNEDVLRLTRRIFRRAAHLLRWKEGQQ